MLVYPNPYIVSWESSCAKQETAAPTCNGWLTHSYKWVGKFDLPHCSYVKVSHLTTFEHSLPSDGLQTTRGIDVKGMLLFDIHWVIELLYDFVYYYYNINIRVKH